MTDIAEVIADILDVSADEVRLALSEKWTDKQLVLAVEAVNWYLPVADLKFQDFARLTKYLSWDTPGFYVVVNMLMNMLSITLSPVQPRAYVLEDDVRDEPTMKKSA